MIKTDYIKELARKGERADGRKFDEYRTPITVEFGVSSKSAEGSARVLIGDTEVIAGVKMELGKPYPDKPDEGSIMVNVELLPLASPKFENGPPSIDAIELARVVDRAIRESGSINFKKLCIEEGEKSWTVIIDIYPINAAGNLFDACSLAALAAVKDARLPKLEGDVVDYKNRTDEKLPVEKDALECTVYKVGNVLMIDPTEDEEQAASARLTVGVTEKGRICAMQKGGYEKLTQEEIIQMVDLAIAKTAELRKALENGKLYEI
ncbi:exosome complex protein Rrp42 [Candidatus Woesearchaeota archaeon]|nr:MAG: exosome complex protein Rrp42 [Candidatus Woesearchaeota archaeon]